MIVMKMFFNVHIFFNDEILKIQKAAVCCRLLQFLQKNCILLQIFNIVQKLQ